MEDINKAQSAKHPKRVILEDVMFEKLKGMTDQQFTCLDMLLSGMETLRQAEIPDYEDFVNLKIMHISASMIEAMGAIEVCEGQIPGGAILKPAHRVAVHSMLLSEALIAEVRFDGHPFFLLKKEGAKPQPHNEANPESQR